jgi:hypothetical protein
MECSHHSRAGHQSGGVATGKGHIQSQGQLGAGPGLQARQVELGGSGRQQGFTSWYELLAAVVQFPGSSECIAQT